MDTSTLRVGACGARVSGLKSILKALEYRVSEAPEDFDMSTRSAVEAFQNDYGLSIDGVVGEKTWFALEQAYAKNTGEPDAPAAPGEPAREAAQAVPELREGASGEHVIKLQEGLSQLGFLAKGPCGFFGNETVAAIQAFQRSEGLPADGVAGPGTLRQLDAALDKLSCDAPRAKKPGARVKELQLKLAILGFYNGPLDGELGAATKSAVRSFQQTTGLAEDGVAGPGTWEALENAFFSPAEMPPPDIRPNLRPGSSGEHVAALQERLTELGFSLGKTDGRFGQRTAEALRAFQRAAGLLPDAIAGPTTWAALDNAAPPPCHRQPSLKEGSHGGCVAELQVILKAFGYYTGVVDGKYGRATAEAVKVFQRIYGLEPDGVAGPDTWASLRVLAPPQAEVVESPPEPPWLL